MSIELSKSNALYEEAVRLIPGGSQTMSKRAESFAKGAFPVYLEKGDGCYVWDVDGNRYLDFINALGPITLGYRYPRVDKAVREQLDNGILFSLLHPLEVEAAKSLVDLIPCAEMVRFLKTGAEATSAAARIARAHTGKELIVSYGYHGWLDTWLAEVPGYKGVPGSMSDTIVGFNFGDFESDNSLAAVLNRHKGCVACVFMEPVSYATTEGREFMQWARDLADKHNTLLVFDEIVTGFRMAKGGAQEYWGVTPDIACFAKGISNGLPLAAVVGRREVMESVNQTVISTTYGGETLSLAAAVAAMGEYREKDVIGHMRRLGERLISGANKLAEETGLNMTFKGFAPMSMYNFNYGDPQTDQDLVTLFIQEMAKRGILFRRGGLNFINFSHQDSDIDLALDACREVFPLLRDAQSSNTISKLLEAEKAAAGIRRF